MFLDKAEAFHLDKVEIFMCDGLMCGIGIVLSLDGIKVAKMSQAKKRPQTSYAIELKHDEHVEFMQFQFNDKGIHDVMMKTNQGNMLMMDEESGVNQQAKYYKSQCKDVNLVDNGEALLGFRGTHNNYIETLHVYKAKRLDPNNNNNTKVSNTNTKKHP